MRAEFVQDEIAEQLRVGARIRGRQSERFDETRADSIVRRGPGHEIDFEVECIAEMRDRARDAHRIVRAEQMHFAPGLQFAIHQDRLHAVLAHDAIARLGDDQIDIARRELAQDDARDACRSFRRRCRPRPHR